MKITMTFLPKFFYAAISIFAIFGLMVFGAGGEILAGSGLAGTMDERRKTNQNDSQKQDGHSQIDNRQFTHNDLFVNRIAVNQELTATVPPNNTMPKEVLSNMAGITIEPTATRPKPTRISTMVLNWRGESTGFWGTRTNNSSAIKRNGNTTGNWLSMLAPTAYAGVFLNEGRITII